MFHIFFISLPSVRTIFFKGVDDVKKRSTEYKIKTWKKCFKHLYNLNKQTTEMGAVVARIIVHSYVSLKTISEISSLSSTILT